MATRERISVAVSLQALRGVLADRLQQPIAECATCRRLGCHQRLVPQSAQEAQALARADVASVADRLCCLERPAAGEYRRAMQQQSLIGAQQVKAPVDGRLQRL